MSPPIPIKSIRTKDDQEIFAKCSQSIRSPRLKVAPKLILLPGNDDLKTPTLYRTLSSEELSSCREEAPSQRYPINSLSIDIGAHNNLSIDSHSNVLGNDHVKDVVDDDNDTVVLGIDSMGYAGADSSIHNPPQNLQSSHPSHPTSALSTYSSLMSRNRIKFPEKKPPVPLGVQQLSIAADPLPGHRIISPSTLRSFGFQKSHFNDSDSADNFSRLVAKDISNDTEQTCLNSASNDMNDLNNFHYDISQISIEEGEESEYSINKIDGLPSAKSPTNGHQAPSSSIFR